MRAVFSPGVAVGGEGPAAAGAGKAVDGFAPDSLRMSVPPGGTAAARTESDALPARRLPERRAALRTEVCAEADTAVVRGFRARQPGFSAERDDRVLLQSYGFCNGSVPVPLPAHGRNLVFL